MPCDSEAEGFRHGSNVTRATGFESSFSHQSSEERSMMQIHQQLTYTSLGHHHSTFSTHYLNATKGVLYILHHHFQR